jgi:hypothetical protein
MRAIGIGTRQSSLGAARGTVFAVLLLIVPLCAEAQTSPFLTGATALQTNILAWLTPIAVILVMLLGAMAMANRVAQVSSTYGAGEAQTLVENCGTTLILRCSGSEHGGTSQFASRLIGQREVLRITTSRSQRPNEWFPSITRAEHLSVEPAVMASQIEQLPDLRGYLKLASRPEWRRVRLEPDPCQRERGPRHERQAAPRSASAGIAQRQTLHAPNIVRFHRARAAGDARGAAGLGRADAHDGFEPE